MYRTDVIAEAAGHSVLRLPIAYCELNLIWAQVKGYAAKNTKTFIMTEALKLSHDGIDAMTPENWEACVRHVVDKV